MNQCISKPSNSLAQQSTAHMYTHRTESITKTPFIWKQLTGTVYVIISQFPTFEFDDFSFKKNLTLQICISDHFLKK